MGMAKSLGLNFVFIFLCQSTFAVIGGVPIDPTEAAWASTVNIKMQKGMCTGSVLAPNVILTAAHCRDLFGEVQLVAHIHAKATKPCAISMVEESVYIPQAQPILYSKVHAPDILLLKLATPLCGVQSAVLEKSPMLSDDVFYGAGHGRGNKKYGEIEKFELQVIENSKAESFIFPMDEWVVEFMQEGLNYYQFALPVKEQTSFCYGDSGGPVYREENGVMKISAVNGAVIQNTKIGANDCNLSYVQAIAPVAPYVDMIESQVNQWSEVTQSAVLVE